MSSPIPQVEPALPQQASAEKRLRGPDAAIPFAWWLQQTEFSPGEIAREEPPPATREPSGQARQFPERATAESPTEQQSRESQRPENESDAPQQTTSNDTPTGSPSAEKPAAESQEHRSAADEGNSEESQNNRQPGPTAAAEKKPRVPQQTPVDLSEGGGEKTLSAEPAPPVLEQNEQHSEFPGPLQSESKSEPVSAQESETSVTVATQNLAEESPSPPGTNGEELDETPEREEPPQAKSVSGPALNNAAGGAAFVQGEEPPSREVEQPEPASPSQEPGAESGEPEAVPRPRSEPRYPTQAATRQAETLPVPGASPAAIASTNENNPPDAGPNAALPEETTLGGKSSLGSPATQESALPPRIENALQRVEQQLSQVPEVGASKSPTAEGPGKPMPGIDGPGKPETQKLLLRVVQAMRQAARRQGVVRMKLHPPELGSVELQLRLRRGGVEADLRVESSQAQQALLENLHQLRQRLAEQDVKILRFEVDLMNQPPGHFADRQGAQQRQAPAPRTYAGPGAPAGIETDPHAPATSPLVGEDRVDVIV